MLHKNDFFRYEEGNFDFFCLFSKKSMESRRRELTQTASATMLDYVVKNIEEIIFNPSRFVFVDATYLHCTGDSLPIAQAIVNLMNRTYEPETKDENDRVSLVSGHFLYGIALS